MRCFCMLCKILPPPSVSIVWLRAPISRFGQSANCSFTTASNSIWTKHKCTTHSVWHTMRARTHIIITEWHPSNLLVYAFFFLSFSPLYVIPSVFLVLRSVFFLCAICSVFIFVRFYLSIYLLWPKFSHIRCATVERQQNHFDSTQTVTKDSRMPKFDFQRIQ